MAFAVVDQCTMPFVFICCGVAGCFACGMENGFRVYNTDPLKEKEKQGIYILAEVVTRLFFRYNSAIILTSEFAGRTEICNVATLERKKLSGNNYQYRN